MPDNCNLISSVNNPILDFLNLITLLFCYPLYTFPFLMLVVGFIMTFTGTTTDKEGKTSYKTTPSIIGIILLILAILAIIYNIYNAIKK